MRSWLQAPYAVLLVCCGIVLARTSAQVPEQGSAHTGGKIDVKLTGGILPSKQETKLIELINAERQKHKLAPLRPAALLFQAARAHAANMAKQDKMAHILDGKDQFQRIKATGYRYRYAAENVGRGEDAELAAVVKGWMDSKGHREAILNPQYTETGVGIAKAGKHVLYYAQEFARPRPVVVEEEDDGVKLTEEEQRVLDLTNAARKEKKLPALKLNAQLTEAARKHSANMAKQRKLEHKLDGKTAQERVKATGYKSLGVGENIYRGKVKGIQAAQQAFATWMKSAGHRENILLPEFSEIGIGTVANDRGEIYFTQVFGAPAKR